MNHLGLKSAVLVGNSMGGHIALIFAKEHPEMVDGMVLTGSSGLFENSLGNTFPRRGDKEYIRQKTQEVFYDPKVATDELVDRVYALANKRTSTLKLLGYAKSAIRHNMANDIPNLKYRDFVRGTLYRALGNLGGSGELCWAERWRAKRTRHRTWKVAQNVDSTSPS